MSKIDDLRNAQKSDRMLPKRETSEPTKTVLSEEIIKNKHEKIKENEVNLKIETSRKSKNEGTLYVSVKYVEALDQEFFNAQATLHSMAKWEYLDFLIQEDLNCIINRDDELHKEIKATKIFKPGTIPVTNTMKKIMIHQAALNSFSGYSTYVAYLVRKKRLTTDGWY